MSNLESKEYIGVEKEAISFGVPNGFFNMVFWLFIGVVGGIIWLILVIMAISEQKHFDLKEDWFFILVLADVILAFVMFRLWTRGEVVPLSVDRLRSGPVTVLYATAWSVSIPTSNAVFNFSIS